MTTTHPEHFRRRDSGSTTGDYLDATVRTASPARLRLMLIERGVEICGSVKRSWKEDAPGINEHSLSLLDIINELLNGVSGSQTESEKEVCQKVSDLYVFLMKHLVAAQADRDTTSLDEIKLVLEAEAETWRAVCAQEMLSQQSAPSTASPSSGGLNFSA